MSPGRPGRSDRTEEVAANSREETSSVRSSMHCIPGMLKRLNWCTKGKMS